MSDYKFKNRKKAHTKADNERKDKVTSVRLSNEQYRKISENAKKNHTTVNEYMVRVAVNGDNTLTPEMMVLMQNQINFACSVVQEYAPDKVDEMQEGVNKLWQKLV